MILMTSVYAQQIYVLSTESILTISGTSTVHDWTVTANKIDGSIKVLETTPTEIDFQVDVVEIKSERGATMDNKMHAALNKEEHPKVLFNLKELKGETTLSGTLVIGGKTKNVEFESTIVPTKNVIRLTGEYKMALKDFEIEPPTAMFGQVIVGEDVTVHFDLIFENDN